MFGPPPLPRQAGRPASSTPLADHLARGWPGVDSGYVVLPRSLAEAMPLPWQQQMVNLLAQFHETHGRLSWPVYRVVPSRPERLVDLDEEQLAEAGYVVEIDANGEMIYRERSGRKVENPETTTVLVSCLDPIVPPPERADTGVAATAQAAQGQPEQSGSPRTPVPGEPGPEVAGSTAEAAQERTQPAPMNIGPQPVWHPVAPTGSPEPQQAPAQPQQPQVPQGTPGQYAPAPAQPVPSPEQQPIPPAQPSQQPAPPPASQGPPAPAPAQPATSEQDADTPARGTPLPGATATAGGGWFDEHAGSAGDSGSDEAAFGPTGEPTEIPYPYQR